MPPCCIWTATISSTSTTATAMPPATRCWSRWPSASAPACAAATPWRASAATNSRCWPPRCARRPTSSRSPNISCRRWLARSTCPTAARCRPRSASGWLSSRSTRKAARPCCTPPTPPCTAPSDAPAASGKAPSRASTSRSENPHVCKPSIEVRGLGKIRPMAENRTAAGRAENRRVAIIVSVD
ncbi:exported hypothetical protein [Cupriavidus taiwanensis]|nr:exported hypothetical protein [Cupriavidus taiwanensis]